MNITESLLHALKAHGAHEIFGIPGDFALPYFRIIEESGILPLYTLSHEPGVGFAADASARYHGTLGVAAVTYGAGALNMVNAVASAFAEKSPLVILSGGPGKNDARSGLLLHHQAKTLDSQFQIYREITCDQVRLDDAARAPADIARVLANCRRHSRPVYIELPRDMVSTPCATTPTTEPAGPDPDALAACVDEILGRLAAATAPVLMVGVEVRRFGLEAKAAELARRLALPVVTSFMGRGLLAAANAPLMGTYLGIAGAPDVTTAVESSDGLFLLGVIISDTNFGVSDKKIDLRKTIQALDRRVTMGYHTYDAIGLESLVDALLARTVPSDRHFDVKKQDYPFDLPDDDAPLMPLDIATAVNDLMRDKGRMPIASDIGDCLFTAMDMANTELVAPGYYATMGFGVPAGIGLQAASGERTLILVGDGAFQMTGWELGNCRRFGFDPIVIVFNNQSWEMLRTFQPQSGFNDLDDWHFAEMAPAMGGEGVRVSTRRELKHALAEAHATRGKFRLIEVMLPRGALSPTLARFVTGLRRLTANPG
ncbi:MAG TPA: indolepyruvate/phenylpyruvate decarboxylase [Accumulibacter sp.]|uniref:Indole-3-pyruvate decarboxylase n=4 Tax=Candidatus Accumulibacter TaxID=327159 RepID=A0A080MDR3_9PROT|nr:MULTISPECIES: indolepyruvate/phenylpyruvate decarboxylase [Candidatus Accumulibacter]MCQ1550658.1 indolepyruvate/phenylpyruvate decarboxylase [Candidatus Accumulibacter phosphatis]KFB78570.1 MAG: Indole-3-pyruvate decarboxylase [Candidatus Accumulibacter cognatus]MBN8519823.1 indolepyruvate/phenylpyruvate decarboxylase [Accumulibacter sp.]MBO3711530.1 indolepyruvate/phenylpyruvate decarboxylase [Accumulibacter sp.]HMW56218.1 indolepyruvate/phenylpyruvate decarboxylase [Accumulibacter sp.]